MILIMIIMLMILRNAFFLKQMGLFYTTMYFRYSVSIFRAANTRWTSGEEGKSFIRNVVFNLFRDFQQDIVTWILIDGKGIPNLPKLKKQIAFVIFITFVFQKVHRDAFRRVRYFWCWVGLEWWIR